MTMIKTTFLVFGAGFVFGLGVLAVEYVICSSSALLKELWLEIKIWYWKKGIEKQIKEKR